MDFSSSNASASLRISQLDGSGAAMASSARDTWGTQVPWVGAVTAIDVYDASFSYAGRADGTILRTINDGTTWNAETSGTTSQINEIAAIDGTNAYAVTGCFFGCPGVLKRTTVGGTTWASQTVPAAVTGQLYGIDYVPGTPNTAIAVGAGGKIIRTIDGGTNWNVIASGTAVNLKDVDMVTALVGYIAGESGTVLRTGDAGATWAPIATPGAALTLLHLSSPAAGTVFVNTNGAVYRSQNADSGAATWTTLTPAGSTYTDVVARTTSDVYVSSWMGVARSQDANLATPTWALTTQPSSDFLENVDVDATAAHVKSGAWQANIFGTSTMVSPMNVEYSASTSVENIDTWGSTTALAVGSLGHAWRTTDSGTTWTKVDTSTGRSMFGVDLVSATEAWAAASSGNVLHTTNLGTTWTAIATGAPGAPPLVDIIKSNTGALLAVGSSGTIMRSQDDGASWYSINSGVATNLRRIDQAPEGGRLWIVGNTGTVLTSVDDGRTWTNRSTGALDINDVTATDVDSAWIAGASNTVLKTTNAGVGWSAVGGLPAASWYAIDSTGPDVIALSGGASYNRAITVDGGTTWATTTGLFNALTIALADANTVYAGGTGGSIVGVTPASSMPDFTTWAAGGFGACLQAVGLTAAVDQWAVANGGVCDTADSTEFHAVPTAATTIARTASAGALGRADVIWGVKAPLSQPAGAYIAPIEFEVVAPAI
jgi:photosystem II stability/assembly factor-like uncharacterized protein